MNKKKENKFLITSYNLINKLNNNNNNSKYKTGRTSFKNIFSLNDNYISTSNTNNTNISINKSFLKISPKNLKENRKNNYNNFIVNYRLKQKIKPINSINSKELSNNTEHFSNDSSNNKNKKNVSNINSPKKKFCIKGNQFFNLIHHNKEIFLKRLDRNNKFLQVSSELTTKDKNKNNKDNSLTLRKKIINNDGLENKSMALSKTNIPFLTGINLINCKKKEKEKEKKKEGFNILKKRIFCSKEDNSKENDTSYSINTSKKINELGSMEKKGNKTSRIIKRDHLKNQVLNTSSPRMEKKPILNGGNNIKKINTYFEFLRNNNILNKNVASHFYPSVFKSTNKYANKCEINFNNNNKNINTNFNKINIYNNHPKKKRIKQLFNNQNLNFIKANNLNYEPQKSNNIINKIRNRRLKSESQMIDKVTVKKIKKLFKKNSKNISDLKIVNSKSKLSLLDYNEINSNIFSNKNSSKSNSHSKEKNNKKENSKNDRFNFIFPLSISLSHQKSLSFLSDPNKNKLLRSYTPDILSPKGNFNYFLDKINMIDNEKSNLCFQSNNNISNPKLFNDLRNNENSKISKQHWYKRNSNIELNSERNFYSSQVGPEDIHFRFVELSKQSRTLYPEYYSKEKFNKNNIILNPVELNENGYLQEYFSNYGEKIPFI